MKALYQEVEMEVIAFEAEDVITSSGSCQWESEEG